MRYRHPTEGHTGRDRPFLPEHARPATNLGVAPGPVPRERLRSLADALRRRVEAEGRPRTLRAALASGAPPYAL